MVLWLPSGNRDERVFERPYISSTSADNPTVTWHSAAAITSAWAPRWPAPSCACCSRNCFSSFTIELVGPAVPVCSLAVNGPQTLSLRVG